jgi:hypothetical protein
VAAFHIVVANEPPLELEVLDAPELEDPLELPAPVVVVVLPGNTRASPSVDFGGTAAAGSVVALLTLEALSDESPPQPANRLVQAMQLRIE